MSQPTEGERQCFPPPSCEGPRVLFGIPKNDGTRLRVSSSSQITATRALLSSFCLHILLTKYLEPKRVRWIPCGICG